MNSFSTARVPSNPPMAPLSFHDTPSAHATGRPTHERIVCRFSGKNASLAWTHPMPPLTSAISAMNEISIAITLSIR